MNGRLPTSELTRVYHPSLTLYLEDEAAAALNTINAYCAHHFKTRIYPGGPDSAYRTLARQQYWKKYWCGKGRCQNAATPGRSNHGWGKAADIAQWVQQKLMHRVGKKAGWTHGEVPWEPWHFTFTGTFKHPNPGTDYKNPVARKGSGGPLQAWYVKSLQKKLRKAGFKIAVDGDFGEATRIAVKRYQKSRGLKADGICGKTTWVALRKNAKPVPVKHEDDEPPKPRERKPTTPPRRVRPTNISRRAFDLIAEFEGVVLKPYNDAANHATIGIGHLLHKGPVTKADEKQWRGFTRDQAYALFKKDVEDFEAAVRRLVKIQITQNQFDALVSFAFNVGIGALESSTLLKKLNARDISGAANEFLRWDKAGGRVLAGLTRRRRAERELFLRRS